MTKHTIRVVMPYHLQTLAKIGSEVSFQVDVPITYESVIDAVATADPTPRGTIRDHVTKQRRPILRYFACSKDASQEPPDTPVPAPILSGAEPFIIWGAIAGG